MATATKKTGARAGATKTARGAKTAAEPAADPAKAAKEAKAAEAGKTAKPVKAAKPPKVAKPAKPEPKAAKAKKPKLVRDSFTMPKTEYTVLESLKVRAAKAGSPAKKSELLRAGVQALAAMQDAAFLATLAAVPALKTGRPAKA